MTLLKFSQTTMPVKKQTVFPLRIAFPAHKWLAAPEGQWQRLPDGRIAVTFENEDQLAWCIYVSVVARDAEANRPVATAEPAPPLQAELIPSKSKSYYRE